MSATLAVQRIPLVAGNWKMYGSRASVATLVTGLLAHRPRVAEMVVCPPFVFLDSVGQRLAGSGIGLGAQNLSAHAEGAYTGEVAASMLREFGCRYVIVGHSERRALYGETDAQIAQKCVAARDSGLTAILCVGENLAEREANQTLAVVDRQLRVVLEALEASAGENAHHDIVVAYEPVWAIGTGRTALPEQAQQVHGALRDRLGRLGASTRVIYGGSVKAENARALFAQPDIDGALVGGAALNAETFTAICAMAEND